MKNKLLKIVLLNSIVMVLITSGCSNKNVDDTIVDYLEESSAMQSVEMTEQEKLLLKEIYINEQNIDNGKLYDYQEKCLEQIRFADNYLNNKYTDDNFEIINCSPMSKLSCITTMSFTANEDEKVYDLQISMVDGQYVAEDNYYGYLIREKYDEILGELLKKNGYSNFSVKTDFSTVYGKDINGEIDCEAIIEENMKISRTTDITLNNAGDNSDIIAAEIKEFIQEKEIYGAYNIYDNSGLIIYFNCF